MTTALLYDDLCLMHLADAPHVERPARLRAIVAALKAEGLWEACTHPAPRDATSEELMRVHTAEYLQTVRRTAERGGGALDPDTPLTRGSYAAAVRAAGLALVGCDEIMEGRAANAFALTRPPGHHALPDRGMGFCLFNNIAIAARHLQDRWRLARILILDWDIHHGNGTEATFAADPRVLYVSAHAWPFYPGTGGPGRGTPGAGAGNIINLPMPHGTPRDVFVAALEDALRGPAAAFRPEFVLISAGFDAAAGDTLGIFDLAPEDYARLTRAALDVAAASAGGRVLSVLEGGYDLTMLGRCAAAHVRALLAAAGGRRS